MELARYRKTKAARCVWTACEPLEHRRLLSGYGPLFPAASFLPFPNGANARSAVTFDSAGNLWGTTSAGGAAGYGTIFEVANGSSAITTVVSFNGINGASPYAGVTFDTNGNLWGTTYNGGSGAVGEVYEIVKGNSTITTVASFNTSNGAHPMSGVTFDANGNLFGTSYNGGSGSAGTIFEIARGGSAITTVASFNGTNGKYPEASVTFDAGGNLWGTTFNGGSGSVGTIFEIPKGGSAITTDLSFNGTNGSNPAAAVTFDTSGNLWGTTQSGATYGYGNVFEVAKGSSAITSVQTFSGNSGFALPTGVTFDASGNLWGAIYGGSGSFGSVFEISKGFTHFTGSTDFSGNNGSHPDAAFTLDSSGNLWGTTYNGGSGTAGTIFEVGKDNLGNPTINTVANFNANTGDLPRAGVTFDSNGNLWGTTRNGGPSDDGTVFEMVKGTSTITTVASFNGTNGQYPDDPVTFDANGNLWGTSYQNGPGGWGTVFEIAKGTSTIITVASFNASNGAWPTAPVTFDASGNLWGTTTENNYHTNGTVFEIAKGTSTINIVATLPEYLETGVTFDSNGNLFGTAVFAGASGDGAVFEIAKGTTGAALVATFNLSTGIYPEAPVTFDSAGNLWGTTLSAGGYGAISGTGTVFEMLKGSSTITAVASFNGSGAILQSPVTFDASGNLWSVMYNAGSGSFGTVIEIAKGTSTVTTVAAFNQSNGAGPEGAVTFDSSGNIWGTAFRGGAANAGDVWEISQRPTWLSDPAGNDTWNTASHTLIVNDPSTIIADPGTDQPIIQANGSAAIVTINPSNGLQVHLGGLNLTNGASAVVTSLGATRSATNHRVLVLGLSGATSAPLFTIDATSKLDLTDNDLVDHDGGLSSVSGLLTSGFTSGWAGNGIVSSIAATSTLNAIGITQPTSTTTFDNESITPTDLQLRYTYFGDANLDGHTDGSDYTQIDSGLLTQSTGWSNGDFNYDGIINGSDYTLIDNAFNTQGATLAAQLAPLRVRNKIAGQITTPAFTPTVFNSQTPIAFIQSTHQNIEQILQQKDLLDQLWRRG